MPNLSPGNRFSAFAAGSKAFQLPGLRVAAIAGLNPSGRIDSRGATPRDAGGD